MNVAAHPILPDTPAELKEIIGSLVQENERYVQENHRYAEKNEHYVQENELLREQIRLLYATLYGTKSEKIAVGGDHPQLPLFDMPEPAELEPEPESVEVPAHSRKKRGRKPLPDHVPRVEIIHDIDEADKQCGCGCRLKRCGEDVCEKLDIIPAVIQVIRHIRPKYACPSCEGLDTEGAVVKIAPPAKQIIPKGIATAGLLAHVLTAKFCDALPFYRQEQQFRRLGVEIGRATMGNWAFTAAAACRPVIDLLQQEIRSGPLITMDETTVQVLDEPGRSATTKSYMWVCRGGLPDKPGIIYRYAPSRSSTVAESLVGDYTGVVQTDGYIGYDFLDTQPGIIHGGCLVHVRRKFRDAQKARGKAARQTGSSDVALKYIRALYRIEKEMKHPDLSFDEAVKIRHEKARPILTEFHAWLLKKTTQVVPKSLVGKAVCYALNQWDRLLVYLDHGFMTPDNNQTENAIRPFVLGRKNWLFAGTPEGAQASADLFSLIETAKANGLEPYAYLHYLFEKLPFASSKAEYRALLPMDLTPDDIVNGDVVTGV